MTQLHNENEKLTGDSWILYNKEDPNKNGLTELPDNLSFESLYKLRNDLLDRRLENNQNISQKTISSEMFLKKYHIHDEEAFMTFLTRKMKTSFHPKAIQAFIF